MTHDYSHQSTREDPRMMAFFDSLVQREIEGWSSEDMATNLQSPSDSDDVPTAPIEFSDTDSNASAASDSELVRSAVRFKPMPRIKYRGGVAPERPYEPPNRITQLIGSCRKKLMRLAEMEGGAVRNRPSKFNRQQDIDTDDRKTTTDDDEYSARDKLKLKARVKATKRKQLRLLAQRSKVRRKCSVLKIPSDSESDQEWRPQSRSQTTEKAVELPVIDTAQPSTSSGLRSQASVRLVRVIMPEKLNHSSSSSDENEIAIKRRCLKVQQGTSSSSGKPERCKHTTQTDEGTINSIQSTNGSNVDDIINTEDTTSTSLNRRVPPTPDSGVASSVSTVEKFDTTANTSRNGADPSDCDLSECERRKIKKSIECFKKKVDAARKGYRKRSAP